MADIKSKTLTIRVPPEVKEGLHAFIQQVKRSLVNVNEIVIRVYCAHKGVAIKRAGSAG